jgi:hypothetical protein
MEYYSLDSSGSGQELVAGSCEYGNEPSDSIKKQREKPWPAEQPSAWKQVSCIMEFFVKYHKLLQNFKTVQ